MNKVDRSWLVEVEREMAQFAKKHETLLRSTDRELSAAFEIGCFHALLHFYDRQGYIALPKNITTDGEYRYLTSPSGDPKNFSYIELTGPDGIFELRQQIRIESHINQDIRFTPDLLVLSQGSEISAVKNPDFAGGKRSFFSISSRQVVAAHECKSMNPFPELLVSYLGMLIAGHSWYPDAGYVSLTKDQGHLGPTLFVGGTARSLHLKMISAMQESLRLNVICGLHEGTWQLTDAKNRLLWHSAASLAPIESEQIPF